MSTPVENKHDDLSPTELASLRRKKNADAQAAFRSRRANYIANLEETVTRLEFVVRQLQNNCREARDLAEEAKQENVELRATINSLRQAERERERVWRALNNRGGPQATLSDTSSDTDGSLVHPSCQQQLGMVQMGDTLMDYQGRSLAYPQHNELAVHQLPSPADTMNALPSYDAYGNQNMMMSSANYSLFNDHHDGSAQWTNTSMGGNAYSSMDDGSGAAPMTCSPGSGQIIIPELSDENQMDRNTMVRFHNSPGTLTTFDPTVVHMRHPSTSASNSDHGASSEEVEVMDPQTPRRLTRSRSHLRRQSGSDPYPTPSTASSEARRERRRAREGSADAPTFSDTLAVIKAQAFGTARKTRTRANRGVSEHAARVAMEVLEARGLSLGVSLDGMADRRRRRSTRGVADEDRDQA
ncbi:hypothetical protein FRC11_010892 [Ceratobasidium sp. 423]|nr:hypothetical protein FRC11_010892 [Ceratobasidium sp. 423]